MRRLFVVTVAALVFSGAVVYGAQGRGRGNSKVRDGNDEARVSAEIHIFTDREVHVIREWFAKPANLNNLPPGLAKREQLPPGLQRQLVRNGTLPPGLQKKIQPMPRELETQLPRLPEGRRRVVISGSIVLFEEKSGTILDVIARVF